jgi:hypothetical protein
VVSFDGSLKPGVIPDTPQAIAQARRDQDARSDNIDNDDSDHDASNASQEPTPIPTITLPFNVLGSTLDWAFPAPFQHPHVATAPLPAAPFAKRTHDVSTDGLQALPACKEARLMPSESLLVPIPLTPLPVTQALSFQVADPLPALFPTPTFPLPAPTVSLAQTWPLQLSQSLLQLTQTLPSQPALPTMVSASSTLDEARRAGAALAACQAWQEEHQDTV